MFPVAKKEFLTFFASPAAFLFLTVFLAASLFIFFWVEKFFARNVADLRSLFEWMPLLLIFLVAALTMRLWSEERRMGTLEFLVTQPVSPVALVLGKFIASLSLVGLTLLLTLPLPITVSMLGDLDWGPVWGGYLATFFLAAAYIGIGLTVSFISENQIISLIITVVICLLFYLIGTPVITSLFDAESAEILKQIGSGSRFTSVARGVLDFADIYYYLSIAAVFLVLNCYLLESRRWAKPGNPITHRRWRMLLGLMIANLLLANVSLSRLQPLRVDLTQHKLYTISPATQDYLARLKEPLLIRGYFSAKTHPRLAPLVPQLRDLIEEYAVYGGGKVRVEFIDPTVNPEQEQEAANTYGISPVPLQIIDKYNPSVVNVYFNIVVRYGDQFEVLGFRDLIDTRSQSEGDLQIAIRNPEYDITSAIKKVLNEYQSQGDLYAYLSKPLAFTGYISADSVLPEPLLDYKTKIIDILEKAKSIANGQLDYTLIDPVANHTETAEKIAKQFGFMPMRAGANDQQGFYFYMLLEDGKKAIQLPLPPDPEALQNSNFQEVLESAAKRFSIGFVKKIGLYTPPAVKQNPLLRQYRMPSGRNFQQLRQRLTANYDVALVDLETGRVADDVDVLMVLAPQQLKNTEVFAIDQFLMRGGTVIISSGAAEAKFTQYALSAASYPSGLNDWLKHNGISIENTLVLDPQNSVIPLPVTRNVGGVPVREIKMLHYPYAIDVRDTQLSDEHLITSGFNQMPIIWASPLTISVDSAEVQVSELMRSSDQSWTSSSMQVLPEFDKYPEYGFPQESEPASYLLGAVIEGEFQSFFKDKPSPLRASKQNSDSEQQSTAVMTDSVLGQSLPSARVVIFSSNEFLTDQTLRLLASANGSVSLNAINLMENTVDWAVEDSALLSIRNRGYFSRTLRPLTQSKELFWEYLNYVFALAGLLVVYLAYKLYQRCKQASHRLLLQGVEQYVR
jgi:ABC-2 type transport system permease protein